MSQNSSQLIRNLRQEYSRHELDESAVAPNPIRQFQTWLHEAITAEIPEPHAMTLATCSRNGIPSARIVLLRGADESGFSFFTNYDSRKGQDLAKNARAALVLFWSELERQVRVEGTVTKVSAEESDEYFLGRPQGSKLGAWSSSQSVAIGGRAELERNFQELNARYPDGNIPRPPNWGGYRVAPHSIEFWQGRPSRLHDRIRYRLQENGSWLIERLAP